VRSAYAILTATLALAACAGPPDLSVDQAWVRLPAVAGRPGAAYFTVHGGPDARTLVSVSADRALRAEMHESMTGAGAGGQGMGAMAGMRPLAAVPVPAGADVAFAPGGRHVMLYGLDAGAKPGTTTLLTLTFADSTRIYRKAYVVGAGDPAPE